MSIFKAIFKGMGTTLRKPRLLVILYVANLAFAVVAAAPFLLLIQRELGHSFLGSNIRPVDVMWLGEAVLKYQEALPALLGLISLLAALGPASARADEFSEPRRRMVEAQIRARDVRSPLVLSAMEKVPRHLFVPKTFRPQAYDDYPLPIGENQTISQPYIVALMTSLLELKERGDRFPGSRDGARGARRNTLSQAYREAESAAALLRDSFWERLGQGGQGADNQEVAASDWEAHQKRD